jgi:predicted regulator of Ras-like GTPase activity (Roadblock/LC7/MglB family)
VEAVFDEAPPVLSAEPPGDEDWVNEPDPAAEVEPPATKETPAVPDQPSPQAYEAPARKSALTVTETLAELYRAQGHLGDAARTYEVLAEATPDEPSSRAFREKATVIAAEDRANPAGRLRAWARGLPESPRTRIEEMGGVLEAMRTRAPGVIAVILTDLEGVPVVATGDAGASATEALVAELTAFWKSVQRTEDETDTGALHAVSLRGEAGAALVTAVSPEYSLILHVERDAPLGRIRYEAARAAGLLRPALG